MIDSLVILDDQTIWHRRFIEALADVMPITVLRPRTRRWPFGMTQIKDTPYLAYSVNVPPGWASKTAKIAQPLLNRAVTRAASDLSGQSGLMIMSPAYASLASALSKTRPVVTYTADDYRSYAGWGGTEAIKALEAKAMSGASLNLFVSDSLRTRAVTEYGLDPERTLVSPNATEARFLRREGGQQETVLDDVAQPVIGLLGALSDRLDLDFIARVADLEEIGTVFVAGPLDRSAEKHPAIANHPKIKISGRLPHSDMHRYAQSFDAALIPYAAGDLNWHCSPMRLFDHLASGVPIYGLNTCAQLIDQEKDSIYVQDETLLIEKIQTSVTVRLSGLPVENGPPILWSDRADKFFSALRSRPPKSSGSPFGT